jgi:hypothetical protein
MNSDCSAVLAVDDEFFIATSLPWGITAKNNDVNGWSIKTFCYRCTGTANGGFSKDTITGWTIR